MLLILVFQLFPFITGSDSFVCLCLFLWLTAHHTAMLTNPDLHSLFSVLVTAMVQQDTAKKKTGPPRFQHLPKERGTPWILLTPGLQRILTAGITQPKSSNLRGFRHAKSSPSGMPKNADRGSRWNRRNSKLPYSIVHTSRRGKTRIIGLSPSISTPDPLYHLQNPKNVRWGPRTRER